MPIETTPLRCAFLLGWSLAQAIYRDSSPYEVTIDINAIKVCLGALGLDDPNLIGILDGALEFIRGKVSSGEEVSKADLERLRKDLLRCEGLIRELLNL
ncbi:MAG: hypothetical protein QXW19_01415 [Candidatus Bathyarchaeia archaeon]